MAAAPTNHHTQGEDKPSDREFVSFEDAFAALRDVVARTSEFGGDSARVGVAGDSAGGNLAAAVAIACRDAGIALAASVLWLVAARRRGGWPWWRSWSSSSTAPAGAPLRAG